VDELLMKQLRQLFYIVRFAVALRYTTSPVTGTHFFVPGSYTSRGAD